MISGKDIEFSYAKVRAAIDAVHAAIETLESSGVSDELTDKLTRTLRELGYHEAGLSYARKLNGGAT